MKIVIVGAGEVGTHLAKMLSNEDQDIILLDNDQERLDIIDSNYNLMTWNGSSSSFRTLRDIGVQDTDLYIAVTPYETRNISSCCIAKKLGARKTVARIDSDEFQDQANGEVLRSLGVDYLIYPENLASDEINIALRHNWARYWGELHDGGLLLIGVKIRTECPILDCKLKDLPVTGHNFHVAAIKRNNETIIPHGNDAILRDDIVYFITTAPFVEQVRDLCGKKKRNIRKVLIMGGSPIALRFALDYHEHYHIKIIDLDRDHCEQMAMMLPDCEILLGDGRDIEVLRDNNVFQYDAFLALTDSSETNILACLTAKEFGVPKTIADVENIQFLSQAENLNIVIEDMAAAKRRLNEIKHSIKKLGSINVGAIEEYKEVSERYEFLKEQIDDIEKSKQELGKIIDDLTVSMSEKFLTQFNKINNEFKVCFAEIGRAHV